MNRLFYSVPSDDLVASTAWYTSLFDVEVAFDSDWFVHLRGRSNPALELGLLSREHEVLPVRCRDKPSGGMVTVVVDDVDETFTRATALGVDIIEEPRDLFYGQRRMLIVDPNGLVLDVSSECAADPEWLASLSE